jgi:hypothetical protein
MGRRGPHIIPFDDNDYSDVDYVAYPQRVPMSHLLDRTIRRHRVQEGILEVEVYQVVYNLELIEELAMNQEYGV